MVDPHWRQRWTGRKITGSQHDLGKKRNGPGTLERGLEVSLLCFHSLMVGAARRDSKVSAKHQPEQQNLAKG